jgi:hypothetical protein
MSGSMAAQSKAMAPEDRRDCMLMSFADIPDAAPSCNADRQRVFVSIVVVMQRHLWFS